MQSVGTGRVRKLTLPVLYGGYRFAENVKGLPCENVDDLRDIHCVHILIFVPFVRKLRKEEGVLGDSGSGHLFAEKDEISLVDEGDAVTEGGSQPCACKFIALAPGMVPAVI